MEYQVIEILVKVLFQNIEGVVPILLSAIFAEFTLLSKWPDLVITFVGVTAGGYLSWKIAFWQLEHQKKDEEARDLTHLLFILDRIKIEVRDNQHICEQVHLALAEVDHARIDTLRWGKTIAEALSDTAYLDLASSGLQRKLPKYIDDDLFGAYQMIKGLRDMARQAEAAIEFLFGYKAGQESADVQFRNVQTYAATVESHLAWVKNEVYRYADELKRTTSRSSQWNSKDEMPIPPEAKPKDLGLGSSGGIGV